MPIGAIPTRFAEGRISREYTRAPRVKISRKALVIFRRIVHSPARVPAETLGIGIREFDRRTLDSTPSLFTTAKELYWRHQWP
jgi:hypothetical protein